MPPFRRATILAQTAVQKRVKGQNFLVQKKKVKQFGRNGITKWFSRAGGFTHAYRGLYSSG